MFELLTGGDYLFDPASGSLYSKDDDHIAQIIELMGKFPKSLAFSGKYSSDFFNRKGTSIVWPVSLRWGIIGDWLSGKLWHIQKLRFWPLSSVLDKKYLLPKEEADLIASFLNPMLRLHPEKRANAGEMAHHPWLDGIVVQGELDVIRKAEEDFRLTPIGAEPQDRNSHTSLAKYHNLINTVEDTQPQEWCVCG